jgi:hypothetical protein
VFTFDKKKLSEGKCADGHEQELTDHSNGWPNRPLEDLEDEFEVDLEAHEEEGDDEDGGEPDVDAGVQLSLIATDFQTKVAEQ